MFERKKEIVNWLCKDDYASICGYSELEAGTIENDSYETIRENVIKNRKQIAELPDEENPVPDASLTKDELDDLNLELWMGSTDISSYSKKRQLYLADEAIYKLTAIIDYYDSIKEQNSKIREYVKKYENNYDLILKVNNLFYSAVYEYKRSSEHSRYSFVFNVELSRQVEDLEYEPEHFARFIDFNILKGQDDIESIICHKLDLTREQYLALKNYDGTKLPVPEQNEVFFDNKLLNPAVIINKLETLLKKEEMKYVHYLAAKALFNLEALNHAKDYHNFGSPYTDEEIEKGEEILNKILNTKD